MSIEKETNSVCPSEDPSGCLTKEELREHLLELDKPLSDTDADETRSVLHRCPVCNERVKFNHNDDDGTSFYKCTDPQCGKITSTPTYTFYKPMPYLTAESFYENDTFNPTLFASDILANYYIETMKDNETVFRYDEEKGIYTSDGEQFIKERMTRTLGSKTRQHYYPDVAFYIKSKTYIDRPEASTKIALVNGVLNAENGLVTKWSPDEFITTRIPLSYDQNAQCPRILKFLTEVLGQEQLPLIQEWFGYCLYAKMPFHKALLLVGEGANGKSTLSELTRRFLGPDNVSSVALQTLLDNRFASSDLYGKLANICADLTDKPLARTGLFKQLTGNNSVRAEQKFKHPFNFLNVAKLMFSTNKVPETLDDTNAFFRRWIIIICRNTFNGENCDPKILDRITTSEELNGLLNWALEGLKRLLTNGQFSMTDSIEEQRAQYIRKSNSSKAFIEERLTYDPDAKAIIPEATLYETYINFCKTNNLPSSRKAILTQNIHQYLPQAKQTMERIAGKIVHVWQFIRLKEAVTGVTTLLPNHNNE